MTLHPAEPEIILLDEPASAPDAISTLRFEELNRELRNRYTPLLVTHTMQQTAHVSDYTAFMHRGQVIEVGQAAQVFTQPAPARD